jgi:hypothetical protein
MRKPIEKTLTISPETYAYLLDCCKKYYENLAWQFPAECNDGYWCCGLDNGKFTRAIRFDIPNLLIDDYANIVAPNSNRYGREESYDQYALLDFMEYIAINARQIIDRNYHKFMKHDHLDFGERLQGYGIIQDEICMAFNNAFDKAGLLFCMNENLEVERIVDCNVLSPTIKSTVSKISDKGTRELLTEAIALFKQPRPVEHRQAVERIWDALESFKTHFPGLENNRFDEKLATILGNGHDDFAMIFKKELHELGNIGNNYNIRHFNEKQIAVEDERHYDYFFNRCLALISTAIQYLP